jgi:hypothetical protein
VYIRRGEDSTVLYAFKGKLTAAEAKVNLDDEELLEIGYDTVAVINNTWYPQEGSGLYNSCTYAETDLAKELLNTDGFYAYIGANGTLCAYENADQQYESGIHNAVITFQHKEYFKADFLRPVSVESVAAKSFIDAVDFGASGSFLRYEDIVRPYDWRLTWNGWDSHFDNKHENYWQYYGFTIADAAPTLVHHDEVTETIHHNRPGYDQQGNYHYSWNWNEEVVVEPAYDAYEYTGATKNGFIIHADLGNATCTLGGEGSPIPATIVLMANDINNQPEYLLFEPETETVPVEGPSWYKDLNFVNSVIYSRNNNGEISYTITDAKQKSGYGYLTYNNNGTAVNNFSITVPMVVWYKWGKVCTKVTIKVQTTI